MDDNLTPSIVALVRLKRLLTRRTELQAEILEIEAEMRTQLRSVNLTLREKAKLTGISKSTLQRWETD